MSDANDAQRFQIDLFLQNLVKLIPIEIIALFAIIKGMIPATANPVAVWIFLTILVILVPLYIIFAMKVSKISQIVLMTLAFPVWVLAIGGLPISITIVEPWMISVTLALFTLIPPMFYGQRISNEESMTTSRRKIKSWREV